MPPEAFAWAEPLFPPLQLTLDVEAMLALRGEGCDTTTIEELVHPLLSVTVTLYVPAESDAMLVELDPLLQLYMYEAVPPDAVAEALPSVPPLQLTDEVCVVFMVNMDGCVMITLCDPVHPLLSVTVT